MDITTTSMMGPRVTRNTVNVAWVYNNGSNLTGIRWCYMFTPDGAVLICSMTGNPAGSNFKILENFRKATKHEIEFLNFMEEKFGE